MRSILKYIDEALFSSASEFSKADDINELEFVDLGLSVDWAKCNLGADSETDIGHYYMWGSIEPNDNDKCYWDNGPFNNGNKEFDDDYFNSVKNKVCPKGRLAPEYDVAYEESNGEYRIPTKEEFEELIYNTHQKWINNYKGTNVSGMQFINKKDESKYIFIRCCGWRKQSYTKYVNDTITVWTSENNNSDIKRSYYAFVNKFTTDILDCEQIFAFQIRPVYNK